MATKLANLPLEIAHFNNYSKKLFGQKKVCWDTINMLLSMGIIEVSTGFELALAKTGGHTVISKDHADISDGSDAKLSSARTCSKGAQYGAPVTNTKNKTGDLRVQVFERKQNKFYYFVIPYSAYSDIPKTSNIEIPFELDGTPRRIPKRAVYVNWWQFEVKSFTDLSK